MTVSSPSGFARAAGWLLAGVVAALPLQGALAQQASPPTQQPSTRKPPPRPASVYVPPPPGVRFNQSMQQQQVRDQLQKNQLEEQLRQGSVETQKRPSAADPAHTEQLDRASRAQNEVYRARQQDLINRYPSEPAPPPVSTRTSQPAPSSSGG